MNEKNQEESSRMWLTKNGFVFGDKAVKELIARVYTIYVYAQHNGAPISLSEARKEAVIELGRDPKAGLRFK